MSAGILFAYFWAALLSYISPGPDWAVIAPKSIWSMRRGLACALGVQSGLLVHMAIAVLGLSVLIAETEYGLLAMRIAGSVYLLWLGFSTLRTTPQGARWTPEAGTLWRAWRQGFVANVMNPQVVVFFLSILPQFVSPERVENVNAWIVTLGVIDIVVGLLWWVVFVVLVNKVSTMMSSGRFALILNTLSGLFLLLFGLGMMIVSIVEIAPLVIR